jgi:acyl carrier protein
MSNLDKYNQSFMGSFPLDESAFKNNIEYNSIPEWDSIGHMSLIAELEEVFGISMDIDDIIEFSSYKKGIEILTKYEVSI